MLAGIKDFCSAFRSPFDPNSHYIFRRIGFRNITVHLDSHPTCYTIVTVILDLQLSNRFVRSERVFS